MNKEVAGAVLERLFCVMETYRDEMLRSQCRGRPPTPFDLSMLELFDPWLFDRERDPITKLGAIIQSYRTTSFLSPHIYCQFLLLACNYSPVLSVLYELHYDSPLPKPAVVTDWDHAEMKLGGVA